MRVWFRLGSGMGISVPVDSSNTDLRGLGIICLIVCLVGLIVLFSLIGPEIFNTEPVSTQPKYEQGIHKCPNCNAYYATYCCSYRRADGTVVKDKSQADQAFFRCDSCNYGWREYLTNKEN